MLAASFVSSKSSYTAEVRDPQLFSKTQFGKCFSSSWGFHIQQHCNTLDDKVENLLRDKKTLINLSYPMD